MEQGKITLAVAAGATLMLALGAPTASRAASPDSEVSPQAFHQRLAPYGHWLQDPRWGEVWHPTEVPANFRPYRDGHWENTQDYGTVWVSDYSNAADERGRWGDIVFHYGRWVNDPQSGWLWVPGYTWSPAWVVWRQGGGNVGWFPMPPGNYDGVGEYPDDWAGWYGYRGWYGAALTDAAFFAMWSFVPAYDIYAPDIAIDVIGPGVYVGFIGRTAPWTRFEVVNGHLVNRAIDADRFRSAFHRDLPASARNDFLAHHGPIVGLDRSRRLEERGLMHASYPHAGGRVGTMHAGFAHGVMREGAAHNTMHGVYSHSESHYAHPEGYGRSQAMHSNNGERSNEDGNGQRPMAGRANERQERSMSGMGGMGYAQHPANMMGGAPHPQVQQNNQRRPH